MFVGANCQTRVFPHDKQLEQTADSSVIGRISVAARCLYRHTDWQNDFVKRPKMCQTNHRPPTLYRNFLTRKATAKFFPVHNSVFVEDMSELFQVGGSIT